jgi:hypothetical protein
VILCFSPSKIHIPYGIIGYYGVSLGKKIKTSIALDEDLLKWIDKMVNNKRFANRTHAIEYALQKVKERSENNEL